MARRSIVLAVVALSLAVVGCGRTYYTPDVVGIVESHEALADGSDRIELADGRSFTLKTREQVLVVGRALPDVGELFLAGSEPKPWVAALTGTDPCFWIGGSGSEDGDFIASAAGLRLPKADDFDRGSWRESEHEFNGGGFCVNAAGEVTAIR